MFDELSNMIQAKIIIGLLIVGGAIAAVFLVAWILFALVRWVVKGPSPASQNQAPAAQETATPAVEKPSTFFSRMKSIAVSICVGLVVIYGGVSLYPLLKGYLASGESSKSNNEKFIDNVNAQLSLEKSLKNPGVAPPKRDDLATATEAPTIPVVKAEAVVGASNIPVPVEQAPVKSSTIGDVTVNQPVAQRPAAPAPKPTAALIPAVGGRYIDLDRLPRNPSLPQPLMTTDAPPRSALGAR